MSRYEYPEVNIDAVMNNPEEFIIPECLEACKSLWSKNIPTRMCSNYSFDSYIWIDFVLTSDQNIELFYELAKNDNHYAIDGRLHAFRVCSNLKGIDAVQELVRLVDVFAVQDVTKIDYQTAEDFLDQYKHFSVTDSDERNILTSDCYGRIHAAYNPDKKDATLEEALIAKNKIELYIPEENRVYKNKRALDWHIRYIKSQQNTKTK